MRSEPSISLRTAATAFLAILLLTASTAARAQVYQPHMQAALQDLQAAEQELEQADQYHDHGGHAGAATNLIQQAIHQVHEGIEYRNTH